jgi:hypothetical protein
MSESLQILIDLFVDLVCNIIEADGILDELIVIRVIGSRWKIEERPNDISSILILEVNKRVVDGIQDCLEVFTLRR